MANTLNLRKNPHLQVGQQPCKADVEGKLFYQSPHELAAIELLSCCCDVIHLITQIPIQYESEGGKLSNAIVDICVEDAEGNHILIEIKNWDSFIKSGKSHHWFIRESALQQGFSDYILLVDRQLKIEPRYSILHQLYYYVHQTPCADVLERSLAALNQHASTPQKLSQETGIPLVDIYPLLAHGFLAFDTTNFIDRKLSSLSISSPNNLYEVCSYGDIVDPTWSSTLLQTLALGNRISLEQIPFEINPCGRLATRINQHFTIM